MSILAEAVTLGLDLGSSYVKAILLDGQGGIIDKGLCHTGYDFQLGVKALINQLSSTPSATGVTGYGRHEWAGDVRKTEISCIARCARELGMLDGTLVDIGGQDCKIIELSQGKAKQHALNRRCAAGTGSYIEYLGYRLGMTYDEMDRLASETAECYPLNSYCTVFASTEILDCMRNKVPLESLIRGMYASIVMRIREMAPLREPLYLCGGLIEHHQTLRQVFIQVLGIDATQMPHAQHLAAYGAALYAREAVDARAVS